MNLSDYLCVFTVALVQEIPVSYLKKKGYPVCSLRAIQSGYLKQSFDKGVLFLITGVGRQASIEAAFYIKAHLRPHFVINVGSAGATCSDYQLGSFVMIDTFFYGETSHVFDTPSPFELSFTPARGSLISIQDLSFDEKIETDFVDQEAFFQAETFMDSSISFHCFKYITDYYFVNDFEQFNTFLALMPTAFKRFFSWVDAEISGDDISVVIPTFNRCHFLKRAIDSVLSQSVLAQQVIVVDDGSSDGTVELLDTYDDLVSIISLDQNYGVSYSRNVALKQVETEWISFLDSDDEWCFDKLAFQIDYLNRYPFFLMMQSDEKWLFNGQIKNKKKYHLKRAGWLFLDSLDRCLVSPSSVLMHTCLFEKVGFFREDFEACEDYDLWLKILRYFPVGFDSNCTLVKYGGHDDQLSRSVLKLDHFRILSLFDLFLKESVSRYQDMIKDVLIYKLFVLQQGALKRGQGAGFYDELLLHLA